MQLIGSCNCPMSMWQVKMGHRRKCTSGSPKNVQLCNHYNLFAPELQKHGCIWDVDHVDYGKELKCRAAYEKIEKKLQWTGVLFLIMLKPLFILRKLYVTV